MELRRGAQAGPSRTAGQAKPPTEHGDVRFALQWTGLHQQAAAGCRIRHMPMADGSCLGDRRGSAGGQTREATRAIYHQSAPPHVQTDRGIVIYERNEPRNKPEGGVKPRYVLRLKSLFVWFQFISVRIRSDAYAWC